ncbi:MAG: ribosome biogenesis GTPase Der [Candidatus Aureabacteria bacterium]|nr:ribosome biogenesis GTPase Der [Candidatus Auribacterota bacterium]
MSADVRKVTIIGRPNVGKSALFNRLLGKKISIVNPEPGVTRDRVSGRLAHNDCVFELSDTGGIIPGKKDLMETEILKHADRSISMSDVLVLVVDVTAGCMPLDMEVASHARKSGKPLILAVNKCDNPELLNDIALFYEMGIDPVVGVSALHNIGIGGILDRITSLIPFTEEIILPENSLKIAVVGRPNAGKSSFINKLLSEERVIVSEVSGTTRDSIDVEFKAGDTDFILIDTAGIRKRKKIKDAVEKYSVMRAEKSIERADIVFLLIDAQRGPGSIDLKIASFVSNRGKPCIIGVNKWDLVKGCTQESYDDAIKRKMPFLSYAPVVFMSSLTGRNILETVKIFRGVYNMSSIKIPTSELNRLINKAIQKTLPPIVKNSRLKFYYATQCGTCPPSFLFFVNNKELLRKSYENYLVNCIRNHFGIKGSPIFIKFRNRESRYKTQLRH